MTALLLIAALLTQTPSEPPEKKVASGAIAAARAAIDHSKGAKTDANARLKEAESLYAAQKYAEAAKAADAAWQLVSDSKSGPTQFTVEVDAKGKTKVTSIKGQPVRVQAEGVTLPLYAGQIVNVDKGEKPKDVETPVAIAIPELLAPRLNEKFKLKASQKLSKPIAVSWKAVRHATGYEVSVRPAEGDGKPLLLKAVTTKAKLPPLPPGKYLWTVRAVGAEGATGETSAERAFELWRESVKIEVHNTNWK